jgi:hypothetical protein
MQYAVIRNHDNTGTSELIDIFCGNIQKGYYYYLLQITKFSEVPEKAVQVFN